MCARVHLCVACHAEPKKFRSEAPKGKGGSKMAFLMFFLVGVHIIFWLKIPAQLDLGFCPFWCAVFLSSPTASWIRGVPPGVQSTCFSSQPGPPVERVWKRDDLASLLHVFRCHSRHPPPGSPATRTGVVSHQSHRSGAVEVCRGGEGNPGASDRWQCLPPTALFASLGPGCGTRQNPPLQFKGRRASDT